MSIAPNLFLANMRSKGGPAKPSRFEVILPIPQYVGNHIGNSILEKILNFPNSIFSDVSDLINSALPKSIGGSDLIASSNPSISRYLALQCEAAELPGKGLMTHDVKIYGPSFRIPYKVAYEPITLTFLCTNEFEERKLFDKWLESIMPTDTNNLRFPKGTGIGDTYLTTIRIKQYDEFIKQIYAVELIDAFPMRIASQQLHWGSSSFHRLQVQFAYQNYKTIYAGSYDIGNAVTSLLGAGVSNFLPQSL